MLNYAIQQSGPPTLESKASATRRKEGIMSSLEKLVKAYDLGDEPAYQSLKELAKKYTDVNSDVEIKHALEQFRAGVEYVRMLHAMGKLKNQQEPKERNGK